MLSICLLAFALSQSPSEPVLEATLLDGTIVQGRMTGLLLGPQGSGSITLVDGTTTREFPWNRVLRIGRTDNPSARPLAGESLRFADGDLLRGTLRSGDADTIDFAPSAMPDTPLQVPVSRLLGILLNPPPGESERRALEPSLADPTREGESIWLTNGDRRAGSLVAIDRDRVRYQADAGEATLDRSGVTAIAFDPALVDELPAPSFHLEAHLSDGSRLSFAGATLDAGALQVQTRSGLSLRLAPSTLLEIYPRGGAIVYLTERETAAREFVPYFDRHPGRLGIDTTWDGSPLVVRGRRHVHGLGMLPRTLVVYRVEPGDRRFQAVAAVDDRAGEQASVAFRVLLDRREAFASPALSRFDAPVPIDIELGDARLLVLIAEFGERGDVQDQADWLDARIVRDTPRP